MKTEIPNSNDWNTNTDNPLINTFRQLMIENNEFVDDAYVGIFWYDINKNELFGVYSVLSKDIPYTHSKYFDADVRTCSRMHYAAWKKEQYRKKDSRFQGDYTIIPRGRVFEIKDTGFIVCVGNWINRYPQAKQEILFEFQLPEDKTEFIVDEHWDIGHGWSDKVN